MLKPLFFGLCFFWAAFAAAQEPFIRTEFGLGQYGYLELDARTFARLDRNTFTNIDYLRARYYVDDGNAIDMPTNWVYNTPFDWQCSGGMDQFRDSPDFNPLNFGAEWEAGADVDVSVYANYCGGTQSYTDPQVDIGFNQRHYEVVDVDAAAHISDQLGIEDGNGDCTSALVASFTIDVGAKTDLSIERLFVENVGTAQEVTNIPNAAFTVFYEPVTGSESFDGTENIAAFMLFGDWGGNPTNNNIYGAEGLSIPLLTQTRIYIAACDLETGSNGLSIELNIINDGISLGPANDTSFDLLRIDETSISRQALILPVELSGFFGEATPNGIQLNWKTSNEEGFSHFEIERSLDDTTFQSLGRVTANGAGSYAYLDAFSPKVETLYYRLKMVDKDGRYWYSDILRLKPLFTEEITMFFDPAQGGIVVQGLKQQKGDVAVFIYSISGTLVAERQGQLSQPVVNTSAISAGMYIVVLLIDEKRVVNKVVVP
ncbi:MAG: T9SS type A sorting domain-containing protein [Saprospiraceae bacterium]|nr:T9SS type A sorting domain-containing protein [Saprospiraceae bacterium]